MMMMTIMMMKMTMNEEQSRFLLTFAFVAGSTLLPTSIISPFLSIAGKG